MNVSAKTVSLAMDKHVIHCLNVVFFLNYCCKTILIDASSQNRTEHDYVCSYSHDHYLTGNKEYICKGDPTNDLASWIDDYEMEIKFYIATGPDWDSSGKYILASDPKTDVHNMPNIRASQRYQLGSTWKQSLMKCPDLSIPISFYGIDDFNATCSEYLEPGDPCFEVKCKPNSSCKPKGNSYECDCNKGYALINNATDRSGEFSI